MISEKLRALFCFRESYPAALREAGTQRPALRQTDPAGEMGHAGKQTPPNITANDACVRVSVSVCWCQQHAEDPSRSANVFGVELHHLVEKEGSASAVPLLIQKTVAEIERRGLKVVTDTRPSLGQLVYGCFLTRLLLGRGRWWVCTDSVVLLP